LFAKCNLLNPNSNYTYHMLEHFSQRFPHRMILTLGTDYLPNNLSLLSL